MTRYPFTWLLPLLAGLIPVIMGALGIKQLITHRPMKGLWLAISAILLGILNPLLGWLAMFAGVDEVKGPMW